MGHKLFFRYFPAASSQSRTAGLLNPLKTKPNKQKEKHNFELTSFNASVNYNSCSLDTRHEKKRG